MNDGGWSTQNRDRDYSVSTICAVSLFMDNEVYIAHAMLRVGAPGRPLVAADGGYSV